MSLQVEIVALDVGVKGRSGTAAQRITVYPWLNLVDGFVTVDIPSCEGGRYPLLSELFHLLCGCSLALLKTLGCSVEMFSFVRVRRTFPASLP